MAKTPQQQQRLRDFTSSVLSHQFLTLDSLVQCRAVPGTPALLAVDTLRLRRPGLAKWPTLDTIQQYTLFTK